MHFVEIFGKIWKTLCSRLTAIQLAQKLRDHRLNCVGLRTRAPGSQHFPLEARDIQAAGSFLPLLIHFIVQV